MTDDTKHDEPVGYRRPPVATQFKPGVSGNPSGRPKKTKSLQAEICDELAELTPITDNGGSVKITKAKAVARSLVDAAAEGNIRALAILLSYSTQRPDSTDEPSEQDAPDDVEILDDFVDRELRRRTNACDGNVDNSPADPQQELDHED